MIRSSASWFGVENTSCDSSASSDERASSPKWTLASNIRFKKRIQRTFLLSASLDGGEIRIRHFIFGNSGKRYVSILCAVCPRVSVSILKPCWSKLRHAYHRNTPTLSTCAVARKSPVGLNDMLVAMLVVRNASTNRPVGMSKVRMVESMDVVRSQRESGENAYIFNLTLGQTAEWLCNTYHV